MISIGTEYLFWSIFIALGLIAWAIYELHEALRKRSNRYVLPRPDKSVRRHINDHFAGQP